MYLVRYFEYNKWRNQKIEGLQEAVELCLQDGKSAKLFLLKKKKFFGSTKVEMSVEEKIKEIFPQYRWGMWDRITPQPINYFLAHADVCQEIVKKIIRGGNPYKNRNGWDWDQYFMEQLPHICAFSFSYWIAEEIEERKRKKVKKHLAIPFISDLLIDVDSISKVIADRSHAVRKWLKGREDEYFDNIRATLLAIFKGDKLFTQEEERIFLEGIKSEIVPFQNIFGLFLRVRRDYEEKFIKIKKKEKQIPLVS